MKSYKSYAERLKDPQWQKKRLEIMDRDGFSCQHCGDVESTLNVHHCAYAKGAMPWEYESDMLITLCESCHSNHELRLREISILTSKDSRKAVFFCRLFGLVDSEISNEGTEKFVKSILGFIDLMEPRFAYWHLFGESDRLELLDSSILRRRAAAEMISSVMEQLEFMDKYDASVDRRAKDEQG